MKRGTAVVGVVTDNDMALAIGNAGLGYLDNEGDRAWGGYADEVRILPGTPSDAYLAAEYAAMTGALAIESDLCLLEIDQNEHYDDTVTVTSDRPAVSEGIYHRGTTITLTAAPNATGSFRKWYGDIPREGWTNATVSFVIERDSWVYARFVHPWTLSADKTTMSDGNFTVYVSVLNEVAHTLTVGKAAEAGLSPESDTGTGTIDLGGPIWLAGDNTPWTIDKFGGSRGSQSFPVSREGPFRYLSPGTVTTTTAHGTQLFHRGDTGEDKPPLFGAPYTLVVLDEPAGSALICNYMFSSQTDLKKLIIQAPNVTELFQTGDGNSVLARIFSAPSLVDTRFDWWDFLSAINGHIAKATESEDKQLGYFFVKADDATGCISAEQFANKVLFYLYGDVFKSYELPKKDCFQQADNTVLKFRDFFYSEKVEEGEGENRVTHKPGDVKLDVVAAFLRGLKWKGKGVKEEPKGGAADANPD